ncbi:two-component system response regulator [Desulfovibrionales bacterium]
MIDLSVCTILAVDDTPVNLDILVSVLGDLYDLSVVLDGETALEVARAHPPDLILLDIMMPGMDGFEVLRQLKEDARTMDIPVLMLSALSETENKTQCFQLGAVDYLIKPFDVEELLARVRTHLSLGQMQRKLRQHNEILEQKVRERTRELIVTQQATIESMAALAEYRDPETGEHIRRVKGYVGHMAQVLRHHHAYEGQVSDTMVELLSLSAPLHDIGKVGVKDHILLKPGKLDPDEFEEMKRHAEYGRNVIRSVQKKLGAMPFLHVAEDIAYTHHERWDGSGYPRGLRGGDIPLCGRIMALADVYDALISRRVYKPPFAHTEAVRILREGRGTHFDPQLTDIFLEHIEEMRAIALANAESDEQREALSR